MLVSRSERPRVRPGTYPCGKAARTKVVARGRSLLPLAHRAHELLWNVARSLFSEPVLRCQCLTVRSAWVCLESSSIWRSHESMFEIGRRSE